jgi:hypothetical protein
MIKEGVFNFKDIESRAFIDQASLFQDYTLQFIGGLAMLILQMSFGMVERDKLHNLEIMESV